MLPRKIVRRMSELYPRSTRVQWLISPMDNFASFPMCEKNNCLEQAPSLPAPERLYGLFKPYLLPFRSRSLVVYKLPASH